MRWSYKQHALFRKPLIATIHCLEFIEDVSYLYSAWDLTFKGALKQAWRNLKSEYRGE